MRIWCIPFTLTRRTPPTYREDQRPMVTNDLNAHSVGTTQTPAPRWIVSLAGLTLGFGLWVICPLLAGTREPWDVEWPFYPIALVLGGGLIGLRIPGHPLLFYACLWLSQVMASSVLPGHDNSWLALCVLTAGIGSLLGLAGYGLARPIRCFIALALFRGR